MPANNFKLFDENKQNMLSDQEYQASQQRLGGVQAGIASSMLNNKFAYQMSLIAYAVAQMMNANGYDATDALAVSTFVGNLSNSVLQKVIDKATTAEAQAGTNTLKWMTPALVKSFFDYRLATQAEAQAGSIGTKWMSPAKVKAFYNYWKATASEATEGTNDTKWMSPLKVAQAVAPVVNASWVLKQAYTTAGSYTWTAPDLFNGRDYTIGVMVIGGGASGAVAIANHVINLDNETYCVPGSPSGFSICAVVKIVPGQSYPVIVGAGGAAVTNTYSGRSVSRTKGSNGGSSAFNTNLIAQGAQYGDQFDTNYSLDKGGQLQVPLGAMNTNNVMDNMFGGVPIISSGTSSRYNCFVNKMDFLSCFNPFECTRILGAGGGVCFTKSGSTFTNYEGPGGKHPVTGLGATDGVARKLNSSGSVSVVGLPTAPGCGGGSVFAYSYNDVTITATSGAGADGAVMIYIMGVEA